ncbi:MAG: HAMP domain-containing histidine kinase [Chloroflexi bacterium]|nr:HAMP domain-containing histidine kinase [Chloroflexota bacterium]
MKRPLAGLQAKLIAAFVGVTVVSLAVAGVLFVRLREGDQRAQALDHVAAQSGGIYTTFLVRRFEGDDLPDLVAFARQVARDHDVRILITDRARKVLADTDGVLVNRQLVPVPNDVVPSVGANFTELQVEGSRDAALVLLAPGRETFGPMRSASAELRGGAGAAATPVPETAETTGGIAPEAGATPAAATTNGVPGPFRRPGRELSDYQLVFAVSESDLAHAWLELLPGLGIAAGIALPVAILLAVLLARYITRPLRKLTTATNLVADGRFDVDVAVGRRDEVGQLATAFSTMTARVGESRAQMTALIADVSHNLKTPLTSILGFSRALSSGQPATPDEAGRMGQVIHEEAQRLAARLDDLLYLSELESGQALLDTSVIDVSRLVSQAAQRVLGPSDLRYEILPEGSVEATADGEKLERAVENLLDNARKFTPAGGRVSVAVRRNGDVCEISVANPNTELTAGDLPQLFERFYRRRDGNARGSGLGLPIARDIAALHGGTLEAAIDGPDVRFVLSIPALPDGGSPAGYGSG